MRRPAYDMCGFARYSEKEDGMRSREVGGGGWGWKEKVVFFCCCYNNTCLVICKGLWGRRGLRT